MEHAPEGKDPDGPVEGGGGGGEDGGSGGKSGEPADPQEQWKELKGLVTSLEDRLSKNELNYQGFGEIGECAAGLAWGLRGNTTLQRLTLFNCQLGDAGAVAIAEGLRDHKIALSHLDLSSNRIGDTGAVALAEYLRGNTTLVWLELGFNHFGDAGAAAFAEGLRGNTALRELKLHHTRIGDAGAWALVESVKGNTALEYLQLHGGTPISEGSKERKGCLSFFRKPATGKHALQAAWESTRKEAGSRLIQLQL